jgi:hypothetical protein
VATKKTHMVETLSHLNSHLEAPEESPESEILESYELHEATLNSISIVIETTLGIFRIMSVGLQSGTRAWTRIIDGLSNVLQIKRMNMALCIMSSTCL